VMSTPPQPWAVDGQGQRGGATRKRWAEEKGREIGS
jgi:hypothetical protein